MFAFCDIVNNIVYKFFVSYFDFLCEYFNITHRTIGTAMKKEKVLLV